MKKYVVSFMNEIGSAYDDIYDSEQEAIEKMENDWNHMVKSEQEEVDYMYCYEIEVTKEELEAIEDGDLAPDQCFTRSVDDIVINHEILM